MASFDARAPDDVGQAVCAFANDLPDHRRSGVIFVGVNDAGDPTGLEINDALLLKLAHSKTDGTILPLPAMRVERRTLRGQDVAVVTVAPADSPPVRYRGRIWIRVGPRRALATAQEERILNEKRRHGDAPYDARPVRGTSLTDLDLRRFQYLYLPAAFHPEVLARNDRTLVEQLAATKMIASVENPTPTALGLLMLSPRPMQHLPGAYIQFVRYDGLDRAAFVRDNERCEGPIEEQVRCLDRAMSAHVRTSVEIGTETAEIRRSTYALDALKELARNAILHRTYERSYEPIHVAWFDDRVEVISSGGPFGAVTVENFGTPGVVGYRNPNLADAMRVLGLVQRFGAGIGLARSALRANNQTDPEFRVEATRVACTVRIRPDWLPKDRFRPKAHQGIGFQ